MENKRIETIEKKVDALTLLVKQLAALELSKSGLPHEDIGKRLHIAKATVGEMLKGIDKEK